MQAPLPLHRAATTPSPIAASPSPSSSSSRPSRRAGDLQARQQLPPPPLPPIPPPPPPPPTPGLVVPSVFPGVLPRPTETVRPTPGSSESRGFLTATASKTTVTAITGSPADAKEEGSRSTNRSDQGISPGAVVGISVALHIVVTIVLVLVVRAYRLKYKRLKHTQQQPAGGAARHRGGGVGYESRHHPPRRISIRGSPGRMFKKRVSGNARLTQDTNWIKLEDKAAAASGLALPASPRNDVQHNNAPDGVLSPPAPALLPPTFVTTPKNRVVKNNVVNDGSDVVNHHRLPSYRTSSYSTYYSRRGDDDDDDDGDDENNGGDSEEEAMSVWNEARWNEVLFRTLQEPPRSQVASVSQVSLGGPSYYGDEDEDGSEEEEEEESDKANGRSWRPMHSRGRLVDDYGPQQQLDEDEVMQVGRRTKTETETDNGRRPEDNWGRAMMVRDAVPPRLRPATRGSRAAASAACQSHWSFSS
ncbi:hypothetical protein PGQ11_000028 [Apiospora arundinis]